MRLSEHPALQCPPQADDPQGDFEDRAPSSAALAIYERGLGPEHPDTAWSLNNPALLLKTQRDLAGARPLLERALAIYERGLGPDHPDTAQSLNNLARLPSGPG